MPARRSAAAAIQRAPAATAGQRRCWPVAMATPNAPQATKYPATKRPVRAGAGSCPGAGDDVANTRTVGNTDGVIMATIIRVHRPTNAVGLVGIVAEKRRLMIHATAPRARRARAVIVPTAVRMGKNIVLPPQSGTLSLFRFPTEYTPIPMDFSPLGDSAVLIRFAERIEEKTHQLIV